MPASTGARLTGDLASGFGTGTTRHASSFLGGGIGQGAEEVTTSAAANTGTTAGKTVLNAAGTTLAALGTAYSLYDIYN